MNNQIVAVVIAEGTKLIGQYLRNQPIQIKTVQETPTARQSSEVNLGNSSVNTAPKATAIATGCIPCAIGHLGTCSGLLNEAVRFAKSDGVSSDEVIERAGMCLDELNSMERVDLRSEMIVNLPAWEKELADQVLVASRQLRHTLEALESTNALEQAAATAQSTRTAIWKTWIKDKMKHLTPEEQAKIQQRVLDKLEELSSEESEKQ